VSRRSLVVVSAGLSQPSSTRLLADQLAAATRRRLHADAEAVDLRDRAHDLTNHMLTGFPSPELERTLDAVARADGLIAVTPVFNASYSGLFKSFVDVLPEDALADKPVLIGATGGTARHSLALEFAMRPLFAHLRAVVVPTSVFAAPEDWGGATAQGPLAARIERAAAELAVEIERREPPVVVDPFDEPTPFSELLGGSST
jgi:FMN reductase